MRYLLFLLLLISSVTYSQSNVDFRGDSARFYKNGGYMEVVIRNNTKDSTNGVLTNIGNGVTRFLKFRVSNDSLFLGNTFIGLIGGGSTDTTYIKYPGLPDTYITEDGDTVFVGLVQYMNDSTILNQYFVRETKRAWIDTIRAFKGQFTNVDLVPSTTDSAAYKEGRIYYDTGTHTLTLYDNIPGTSVQLSRESIIDGRNNTGSTILNGAAVRVTGAIGQNPTIGLAQANAPSTKNVVGLATHDIGNNTVGKIVTQGVVNDLNTSSFSDGDLLFLSPTVAGGLTTTEPTAPNSSVFVGYVLHAHPTQGKILVANDRRLRDSLFIRNQLSAKEDKNAYIKIFRADSIYTPKLTLGAYAQDNIRPIFRGIDTGSTGGYEGYLYQREGYATRIVDRIRRATGTYQSPTTIAKGNPLYTLQIEARGASSWLSAISAYNILAKTDPISGSSLTPSIAHSWSLRNSGYLGMFFDTTGLRIGVDTFSVNGDAKSTIDLLGSFGKRFRSVAGTGESAGARDNTIYITATFDYTLTLPDATTCPRREYVVKRVDTLLTKAVIKPFSGQKIEGQDSIVLYRNQSYILYSDSTGWQMIAGRETPIHQGEWQARNGISYFQEFISNTAFADGYLVPTSNGTGAGVGRTANIPVALRATNRVGVTAYRTGTTTTGRAGYVSDLNIGENLVLGGGITVFETTVAFPNLSDGTDRYQALFGFGDAPSSVNQSDGIYFLYDEGGVSTGSTASANWQVATVAGGSRTITATSIPVAANQWYRLRIELNFNATRVYFYIDGNLVGQTTLTIPSGTGANGTNFLNQIYKSAGTTDRIALVDYLLFNMRFNTPRY